jgi:hypothetical protein
MGDTSPIANRQSTIVNRQSQISRRPESSILCMSSILLSFEAWGWDWQNVRAAYCPLLPES